MQILWKLEGFCYKVQLSCGYITKDYGYFIFCSRYQNKKKTPQIQKEIKV